MYAKHDNLLGADAWWRQSQHKTPWITFRGHSRSHILGSLKSGRGNCVLLRNNVSLESEISKERSDHLRFSGTPLSFGAKVSIVITVQTDRQTDGRTDLRTAYCGITALCLASRGKNLKQTNPAVAEIADRTFRLFGHLFCTIYGIATECYLA